MVPWEDEFTQALAGGPFAGDGQSLTRERDQAPDSTLRGFHERFAASASPYDTSLDAQHPPRIRGLNHVAVSQSDAFTPTQPGQPQEQCHVSKRRNQPLPGMGIREFTIGKCRDGKCGPAGDATPRFFSLQF